MIKSIRKQVDNNKIFIIIIMVKFSNGKITTSSILYNRGVPSNMKNFVYLASLNYGMLKLVSIYNRKQGRPNYTLF